MAEAFNGINYEKCPATGIVPLSLGEYIKELRMAIMDSDVWYLEQPVLA
jgi:hypothetical protein